MDYGIVCAAVGDGMEANIEEFCVYETIGKKFSLNTTLSSFPITKIP